MNKQTNKYCIFTWSCYVTFSMARCENTEAKPLQASYKKLECGPMPNVMVALPNIGGALCSRRKVWLTPTTRVPRSNAAKTRKPLKFGGVPQTRQQISAVSRPKFTIL